MNNSAIIALLLSSCLVHQTTGMWSVQCLPLLSGRYDPILYKTMKGHQHVISGGSSFKRDMSGVDLVRDSTCTTCNIGQDKSNYWAPAMFWSNGNDFWEFPTQEMAVYYKTHKNPGEKLVAFPKGFRMIAGDKDRRTFDVTKRTNNAAKFNCIKRSGFWRTHSLEELSKRIDECHIIRGEIYFPSCWDGHNLDSGNHQSHVAYPESGNNGDLDGAGRCPPSHPKRFPTLFLEAIWNVRKPQNGGSLHLILAQNDKTGYGFHADFINGWDIPVLQKALDGCGTFGKSDRFSSDCQRHFHIIDIRKRGACKSSEHDFVTVGQKLNALPGKGQTPPTSTHHSQAPTHHTQVSPAPDHSRVTHTVACGHGSDQCTNDYGETQYNPKCLGQESLGCNALGKKCCQFVGFARFTAVQRV